MGRCSLLYFLRPLSIDWQNKKQNYKVNMNHCNCMWLPATRWSCVDAVTGDCRPNPKGKYVTEDQCLNATNCGKGPITYPGGMTFPQPSFVTEQVPDRYRVTVRR